MTFEEEFPSLKSKHSLVVDKHGGITFPPRIPTILPNKLFSKEKIEEHCLDKQRVKEVIEELRKQDWSTNKEDLGLVRAVLFDLEKELSLQ